MGLRRSALRRRIRRRRGVILGLLVVVLFVFALVLYIGKEPGSRSVAVPPGAPSKAVSIDAPSASSGGSPGSSPTPQAVQSSQSGGGPLPLPLPLSPLPGASSEVRNGILPAHVVRMSVRSDTSILRIGYLLKGGEPSSYYRSFVASPASFRVIARGTEPLAEIAAQAGPTAKRISCTISVDGGTPTTHEAKGPYSFVVCLG